MSTCYKDLIPMDKGHPCQTGWASSGRAVWTHQVVSWHILVHAIYFSNLDPQHHARVWMRFHMLLACLLVTFPEQSPCVTFMVQPPMCNLHTFGCTYERTFHLLALHTCFWNDRVWLTLLQENLVECSLVIFPLPSEFTWLA